jgi:TetR/AcrR family transcriptional regulator, cholesterol catabolism regulator
VLGVNQRQVDNRLVAPPLPNDLTATQRARRERIIVCASDNLRKARYEDIQMRDIADGAGVALGTLYRYFSSKEHLFAAVLARWGHGLDSGVKRTPLQGDDIAAQLIDLYSRTIAAFERVPEFFRLRSIIEESDDPHARSLYTDYAGEIGNVLAAPLEPLSADDRSAVNEVLMAALHAALRSWTNGAITVEEAQRRMRRTVGLIFSPPPEAQSSRRSRN